MITSAKESVDKIIAYLGGTGNIVTVTNCMTRLRIVTKDETPVDENGLKEMADVLGLVHDRACAYEIVVGPGKSRKYADICHEMGLPSASGNTSASEENAKVMETVALMLDDEMFIGEIKDYIKDEKCNAEYAVKTKSLEYAKKWKIPIPSILGREHRT